MRGGSPAAAPGSRPTAGDPVVPDHDLKRRPLVGYELFEAAAEYKAVEKKFGGLPAAATAKKLRSKLLKSDEYKATEMLAKSG